MKNFFTGALVVLLTCGVFAVLRDSEVPVVGCKRLSFVTDHGESVYDMCVPGKAGFTLTKEDLSEAESAFLKHATEFWSEKYIKQKFKTNKIRFAVFPFAYAYPPYEYATGTYSARLGIRIGLQPYVDKTSLVHEWIHLMEPDLTHNERPELWEGGLVGRVNAELKQSRIAQ